MHTLQRPKVMTVSLLDLVRTEAETLRQRLGLLDEMESLAQRYIDAGADPILVPSLPAAPVERSADVVARIRGGGAPAPAEPEAPGERDDAPPDEPPAPKRNATRQEVLAHVLGYGPARRGEIHDALGGSVDTIAQHLRELLAEGSIASEGNPPQRRYCAPTTSADAEPTPVDAPSTPVVAPARTAVAPAAPVRARTVAPAAPVDREPPPLSPSARLGSAEEQLLAAITEHGPISTTDLRPLVGGATMGQLMERGRRLYGRKLITYSGEGFDRIWRLANRERDLAAEVVALVRSDPGQLTSQNIALGLGLEDREIGAACAELIDDEVLVLNDDDTYSPADGASGAWSTQRDFIPPEEDR